MTTISQSVINSAIDSGIKNDFFLKHRASKEGKFISSWHENQIVQRTKESAESDARNASQGQCKNSAE